MNNPSFKTKPDSCVEAFNGEDENGRKSQSWDSLQEFKSSVQLDHTFDRTERKQ